MHIFHLPKAVNLRSIIAHRISPEHFALPGAVRTGVAAQLLTQLLNAGAACRKILLIDPGEKLNQVVIKQAGGALRICTCVLASSLLSTHGMPVDCLDAALFAEIECSTLSQVQAVRMRCLPTLLQLKGMQLTVSCRMIGADKHGQKPN